MVELRRDCQSTPGSDGSRAVESVRDQPVFRSRTSWPNAQLRSCNADCPAGHAVWRLPSRQSVSRANHGPRRYLRRLRAETFRIHPEGLRYTYRSAPSPSPSLGTAQLKPSESKTVPSSEKNVVVSQHCACPRFTGHFADSERGLSARFVCLSRICLIVVGACSAGGCGTSRDGPTLMRCTTCQAWSTYNE